MSNDVMEDSRNNEQDQNAIKIRSETNDQDASQETMVGIDDNDVDWGSSINLTTEELSQDDDIGISETDLDASATSSTAPVEGDDALREMMEALREQPKSPKPKSIQMKIKTEHELHSNDDVPMAQSSPSYAASRWGIVSSSGAGVPLGSPSTPLSSAWRNDFVAAVQANKRKRHKAAAAAASKRKAIKIKIQPATPTPKRPPRPKSAESFEASSVASTTSRKSKKGGKRRKAEWTAEEIDIFKQPLRGGWKRELVYRKNQRAGSFADVYYVAPNGIKLRSMTDVDEYFSAPSGVPPPPPGFKPRTSVSVRDHFNFQRRSLGFDEIPGMEIIRGSLSAEVARLMDASDYSDTLNSSRETNKSGKTGSSSSTSSPKRIKLDGGIIQSELSSMDIAGSSEINDIVSSSTNTGTKSPLKFQPLKLTELYKEAFQKERSVPS